MKKTSSESMISKFVTDLINVSVEQSVKFKQVVATIHALTTNVNQLAKAVVKLGEIVQAQQFALRDINAVQTVLVNRIKNEQEEQNKHSVSIDVISKKEKLSKPN